jgi:hypothetical protein
VENNFIANFAHDQGGKRKQNKTYTCTVKRVKSKPLKVGIASDSKILFTLLAQMLFT